MSTESLITLPPLKPLPSLAIADDPHPLRFKDMEAIKTGPCLVKGDPGYDTAEVQIQLAYDQVSQSLFTVWCKTPFAMEQDKPLLVTTEDYGKIIWTNS